MSFIHSRENYFMFVSSPQVCLVCGGVIRSLEVAEHTSVFVLQFLSTSLSLLGLVLYSYGPVPNRILMV